MASDYMAGRGLSGAPGRGGGVLFAPQAPGAGQHGVRGVEVQSGGERAPDVYVATYSWSSPVTTPAVRPHGGVRGFDNLENLGLRDQIFPT